MLILACPANSYHNKLTLQGILDNIRFEASSHSLDPEDYYGALVDGKKVESIDSVWPDVVAAGLATYRPEMLAIDGVRAGIPEDPPREGGISLRAIMIDNIPGTVEEITGRSSVLLLGSDLLPAFKQSSSTLSPIFHAAA